MAPSNVYFLYIQLLASLVLFILILSIVSKIKNKVIYILGLSVLILSIISAILPMYNEKIFYTLYLIGTGLNVIVGLLFFIGVVRYTRNLVDVGFKIGIGAWSLLIICNFYGIFWNLIGLTEYNPEFIILLWSLIKTQDPKILFFASFAPTKGSSIGFHLSIIHLILAFTELILGNIIFKKINENRIKEIS